MVAGTNMFVEQAGNGLGISYLTALAGGAGDPVGSGSAGTGSGGAGTGTGGAGTGSGGGGTGGTGQSNIVFVSVVDETSISGGTLPAQAALFIAEYGSSRPIYVLCPNIPALGGRGLDQLGLDLLPAAVGILVGRTNAGGPVTDWLSLLPPAGEYRVAIDNSGSMTAETVEASLTLFLQRCASVNRTATIINMNDYGAENWIGPHLGFA